MNYLVIFKNGNIHSYEADSYQDLMHQLSDLGYTSKNWISIFVQCGK